MALQLSYREALGGCPWGMLQGAAAAPRAGPEPWAGADFSVHPYYTQQMEGG